MFGVTGIANASDASRFIQQLRAAITSAQFDSLSTLEEQSKLYIQPTDENKVPVFNFALAKVHYIGLAGAPNVRVFFRLFQAQSTTSTFDYPPGQQYRREPSNPDGQPIPLAGIIGNEYVTIPCFANGRVDTTTTSMDQQTDKYNVHSITANTDGSEVDTFYGCWLDINQPFKANGVTPNNVLPAVLDAGFPDGPFKDRATRRCPSKAQFSRICINASSQRLRSIRPRFRSARIHPIGTSSLSGTSPGATPALRRASRRSKSGRPKPGRRPGRRPTN